MKQYKKRTIALVLASVMTVVGAFGAENYRNSLMSLKFESSGSGSVNMTVLTKRDYANSITPVKRDATTYVIMLPETNSQMPSMPELAGDVESVDVKTMPYTKSNRGYTKITVKTLPNTNFKAQKALYLPEKEKKAELPEVESRNEKEFETPARSLDRHSTEYERIEPIRSNSGVNQTVPEDIKKSVQQFETSTVNPEKEEPQEEQSEPVNNSEQPASVDNSADTSSEMPSSELILAILGIILVITVSAFFVLKARDKMAELTGEQQNLDFSDDDAKPKKEDKKTKIKNTIKTLDKMYTKPVVMPVNVVHEVPEEINGTEDNPLAEESVVVDLDELFQEQTQKEPDNIDEEENSALDDFLNSFSFMDEEVPVEDTAVQDELYEKYINDDNLHFSQDDIKKIDKLLNSEISDEAIKTLAQTPVTIPIKKKPDKSEVLENLITSYTINQNISFSKDDVDALRKLINVEIDNDFITDLKCNPQRTQEMQKEIERYKSKPHKTSELITLNVKDMLPDLSEALKKQGGRRIESEVKPQVIYYSEGYDVRTLKLNEDLPDLAKEINNEDAYKSQPSEAIQYAASGYDVAKLSISNELPDLSDVMKNPEKYETQEEAPVEIDEDALIRNLDNVTFTPFQDSYKAPTVSDIQEEFNKLDNNFEILTPEKDCVSEVDINDNDDFSALYDTNYVDLDKENAPVPENENQKEEAVDNTPEFVVQEPEDIVLAPESVNIGPPQVEESIKKEPIEEGAIKAEPVKEKPVRALKVRSSEAQALIKLIETKRAERKVKTHPLARKKTPEPAENQEIKKVEKTCSVEGGMYSILSKTEFTDKMGCYLAKNENGYCVIGYVGDKLFKIKNYEKLKTEKMESRASEKLDNGLTRYIIRLGIHKFIMNVSADDMEYIMDLC